MSSVGARIDNGTIDDISGVSELTEGRAFFVSAGLELVHLGGLKLVHWPTPYRVPECSGVSRLNLALRGGYAGLDTPSALPFSALTWATLPPPFWTSF